LQDLGVLKGLLKAYVQEDPGKCPLKWQCQGLDEVASHYQDFLTAVAQSGHTLSKKAFLQALKEHYESDPRTLDQFAQCMTNTLRDCNRSKRHVTTGDKTSTAVMKIINAFPAASASSKGGACPQQHLPTSASSSCGLATKPGTILCSESESDSTELEAALEMVAAEEAEAESAKAALEQAKRLFGPAPEERSLAKKDSIVSVGSSEPGSPKAAGEEKQALKARAPYILIWVDELESS